MKEISVVLPCFNEGRSIYKNISAIYRYLFDNFDVFEIIAVNDGSRDDTVQELKRASKDVPLKIIDNKINQGKGKAVKDGFLASSYEIVMFLDADLAIPIEEVEKFIAEIEKGSDIVIASRFVPGLKVLRPILWYRKIMEKAFRILRMIIINNYKIKDTQCGFKVFKRKTVSAIFPLLRVKRFAFDSEVIFIGNKKGYKITELPVTLQNPQASSIRIWKDSFNMFLDLLRIRRNYLLGRYDDK